MRRRSLWVIGFGLGTALAILSLGFRTSNSRTPRGDELASNTRDAASSEGHNSSQGESEMLGTQTASVDTHYRGANDPRRGEESVKPAGLDEASRRGGMGNPTIRAITPNAVLGLVRDCPGDGIGVAALYLNLQGRLLVHPQNWMRDGRNGWSRKYSMIWCRCRR
jgi:hypothetical protein